MGVQLTKIMIDSFPERREEMHILKLFIDIIRSTLRKIKHCILPPKCYESLFHCILNYSIKWKWLNWIHVGRGIQNETGTSVPDPWMASHLVNIYHCHFCWRLVCSGLVVEDRMRRRGCVALDWGVEPYGRPLIPLLSMALRCEENHRLSSCFHFYFGHSPLFSNIFSKLICQYYSINCLLSTTIIIKSNGSFLVFVEGATIVRYIDKNSSSTLRYICIY